MVAADAAKTRAAALEEAADAEAAVAHPKKKGATLAARDTATADEEPTSRPALFLAEYETPDDLVHAAEQVRDAGYEKWDCHTPYPVHGLDQAMGLSETKIGFISFVCGMVGLVSAVLMIQYMNNWDYPIIIGGKPPGSFPSMVPIMFELTVLLTGFGTLFGLLHLVLGARRLAPIDVGGDSLWTLLEGGGVFLVLGYVMRFLAQGYGALKPSLLRMDIRWIEAARTLGVGRLRRLRTLWGPATAPGIAAAFLLLFIAVAKELPVTLMLLPAGEQTLAYRIFDAHSEASLPDLGAAGLVLLTLALGVQVGLLRWRHHA